LSHQATPTKEAKSDDPRRRDAASMFTIRNSHGARRRGWITPSTSAAELSVTADNPRERRFRWRCDENDKRDAERAETEQLRDEGKFIEHEANPKPSNKGRDPCNGLIKETTRNRRAHLVHYAGP
jgi:hypothetical protein